MYLYKFRSLQNYQCVALAFCLLLFNQQVVGKVGSRRRYESAFQDLFQKGKNVAQQLASFHLSTKDDKALRQNTDRVMAFVKANPDKIAIGAGLAASSWLLYQSMVLGSEIDRFFDEIQELKGEFKQYYLVEVPKLEELYHRIRRVTDYEEPEKQKAYFRVLYKELMKYYRDLERIMDNVDDIIADVNNAKNDAVISTALSGSIAVLAGVTLVVGGPVAMAPVVWKSGVVTTMGISSVSTVMSLRNAQDLTKASRRLKTLKQDLRQLRGHVMEKMMDIIEYI